MGNQLPVELHIPLNSVNNMLPPSMMEQHGQHHEIGNYLPYFDNNAYRKEDLHGQPTKRQRLDNEPTPSDLQVYQERQFKEMLEPTSRHFAQSKKIILQQHTAREMLSHRHMREKEELEERLRSEWESFRNRCTKEREELIQIQLEALHKTMPESSVPQKVWNC